MGSGDYQLPADEGSRGLGSHWRDYHADAVEGVLLHLCWLHDGASVLLREAGLFIETAAGGYRGEFLLHWLLLDWIVVLLLYKWSFLEIVIKIISFALYFLSLLLSFRYILHVYHLSFTLSKLIIWITYFYLYIRIYLLDYLLAYLFSFDSIFLNLFHWPFYLLYFFTNIAKLKGTQVLIFLFILLRISLMLFMLNFFERYVLTWNILYFF